MGSLLTLLSLLFTLYTLSAGQGMGKIMMVNILNESNCSKEMLVSHLPYKRGGLFSCECVMSASKNILLGSEDHYFSVRTSQGQL